MSQVRFFKGGGCQNLVFLVYFSIQMICYHLSTNQDFLEEYSTVPDVVPVLESGGELCAAVAAHDNSGHPLLVPALLPAVGFVETESLN